MSLNKWTNCVLITRVDGVKLGLTELDIDLTISAQLYLSAVGYSATTTQSTSDLSVNNADVEGLLASVGVDRTDIVAGLYDFAQIEIFIYDYDNETKVRDLGKGTWGETTLVDGKYTAEYRSLSQALQQTVGKVYSAECDATLGDTRCGVTIATYTTTGTITTVTSNQAFADSALIGSQSDDYYNYGLITFTSGLNAGTTLAKEVKTYVDTTGAFIMQLPLPFEVQVGDMFSVYAGCDKRQTTCINTFSNIINFRGFPFIPGQDAITKFGGQ